MSHKSFLKEDDLYNKPIIFNIINTNPNLTLISLPFIYSFTLSTKCKTASVVFSRYISIEPVVSTTKTQSTIPAVAFPL